jgi:prevent-host-death family protein
MTLIDINVAQIDLSRLVDAASSGEEIIIERGGKPVARLMPVAQAPAAKRRVLGQLRGQLIIPDDFDAPLPDSEYDLFEGR